MCRFHRETREFGFCPGSWTVQIEPLALCGFSPEDTASSDSVVANPSSASAPGRSSAVSVTTSFRMSGEPFCTCASKLHARTVSRAHRLCQHSHVCHSIKLLSLRNLRRLLNCTDGWCLMLYHSSDINDPFSVLDLRELLPCLCFSPSRVP